MKVTNRTRLKTSLASIISDATLEIDWTAAGRGGAALIMPPNYRIKNTGKSGTGHAVWMQIETKAGDINIMSLHAPNTREERTILWEQPFNQIQNGKWILAGDYNMVELWGDSRGKTAMIAGAEARAWKSLSQKAWLVAAYICAVDRKGENTQREKETQKREARQGIDQSIELRDLRNITEQEHTEEQKLRIAQLENEIRQHEQQEARAWQIRSKQRWLHEGEAPSRYLFAQMKVRFTRETMSALTLEDGTRITDRKQIIKRAEEFMSQLYRRQEQTEDFMRTREEVYGKITKTITTQQDLQIAAKPPDTEIDMAAKLLKKEKGPGLDGLTTEILFGCWTFVRTDCIKMIHHVWDSGEIIKGARTAVIKMVLKTGNIEKLKIWRPISLMSLTYKLISKIMAERFKKVIPQLVDAQQSGFIKGRSITSNVLGLR
ncbi:hypothetical protein R1sor_023224 [Riccia sorocarpa]|uniref:Reverse transcriptase domain-containing protein n=1 Tax=Riccia sorocarpa TaxID=122646 RepID=A0ABD3GM14_9MARC